MLVSIESLPNSRETAYTAITCCYAGMQKGITVFKDIVAATLKNHIYFKTTQVWGFEYWCD